ncbi:MAG TPA: phage tail assembly protein [Pyrinomonadaceae bacterium]|nr:phage tail assembly protein [Pyrinomonadaceae bacterium]
MSDKDYLKEGDGYVDITLAKPATIAGAKVSSIRMREPTVSDLEAGQKNAGNDAAREITIFANLCEVSPEDLRGLVLRNYARLQAAYQLFTD